MTPPSTRRGDVVDVLHGESIADPYRWLEDTESPETRDWIAVQNAVTFGYLASLSSRKAIRNRLAEIWDSTRYGPPYEHGDRWFFTRHEAGADQPTLQVAPAPNVDGEVLIDPNRLSVDGTVSLAQWHVSRDGNRVVYALSESGSDWMTWRVRDVTTGTDLDDVIRWSKWSPAVWLPDSSGFVYGVLDAPVSGQEYLATNEQMRLMLHRLGDDPAADRLIHVTELEWEVFATGAGSGRWLVITSDTHRGPETTVHVVDLHDDRYEQRPLIPTPEARSLVVGATDTTFFVLTDLDAPNRRVVAIELANPGREHWREVVPEGADPIIDVAESGGRLAVHVLADASSQLQIWSTDGERLHDVVLPPYVTITEEMSGDRTPILHFGITSFTDPASVCACDVLTGAVRSVHESTAPIDAAKLTVTRASAPSADGTPIPMFLVHRHDVAPTGDVPTLLYGYGGFNIPMTPTFNAARLVWAERGGLLVVANLRGGGEYGKSWYDGGRLANKQNVFDDFAGCARWLVDAGWTRPERLAVNGGSNGGLLIGALLTQHPELVGAAVPEVGVMDMLRYHKFTIGSGWMCDYGDPDDAEQYEWVRGFSPLHNLKQGTSYPPTLVMTGDHDDRVVPGHSFKFAATMQAAHAGDAPVLIRVETAAGHGAATPVSKLIDARADMLAFCESALKA